MKLPIIKIILLISYLTTLIILFFNLPTNTIYGNAYRNPLGAYTSSASEVTDTGKTLVYILIITIFFYVLYIIISQINKTIVNRKIHNNKI
jgi:hypothetical protein